MNEYMRHSAGKVHPNCHVHNVWWKQSLTRHHHVCQNLESPVKKYFSRPVLSVVKKYKRSDAYLQAHNLGGTTSSPSGPSCTRSRPGSAGASRSCNRSTAGGGTTRPQSAKSGSGTTVSTGGGVSRPTSAQTTATRPRSAERKGGAQGQWEPFGGMDGQQPPARQIRQGNIQGTRPHHIQSTPHLQPHHHQHQQIEQNLQQGRPSGPRQGSLLTLKKVYYQFQNALEDLDMVEVDISAQPSQQDSTMRKRCALIKLQLAELARQVDLLRDEVAESHRHVLYTSTGGTNISAENYYNSSGGISSEKEIENRIDMTYNTDGM